jgi:serine/threonine protein kinase
VLWVGVDEPWIIPQGLRRFHLQELEKATKNFSQKHYLGMGGFGKVYRGFLSDGKVVAIKCASLQGAQGQKEFQNELTLLGRLHHCHLVELEGFCDDGGLQVRTTPYLCTSSS